MPAAQKATQAKNNLPRRQYLRRIVEIIHAPRHRPACWPWMKIQSDICLVMAAAASTTRSHQQALPFVDF
jgi:hypothetical protein